MASGQTPQHVREKCCEVIDRLNASWDLRIPKTIDRRIDLNRVDDDEKARRCYGRIRFLCDQPHFTFKRVLDDFDESARQISSAWIWKKGSQEKGTLPSLPISKSWLRRDALSKSAHLGLSDEERQDLVSCLFRSLDDEYRLSRESDVYRRSGGNSILASPAKPSLHKSSMSSKPTPAPQMTRSSDVLKAAKPTQIGGGGKRPEKRKASAPHDGLAPTRRKSDRSIREMFTSSSAPTVERDPPPFSTVTPGPAQSFETLPSPKLEAVFSPNPSPDYPLSNATSLLSDAGASEIPNYFPTQEAIALCEEWCLDEVSGISTSLTAPLPANHYWKELIKQGPFRPTQSKLMRPVSFRYRVELQRIANANRIPVEDLWRSVKKKCRDEQPSYDALWNAARSFTEETCRKPLMPEKSTAGAWASATDTYHEKSGRSVILSGVLDWCEPATPGLLKLDLKPMHLDKSCRLHRRFGGDRFMYLTMPYLSGEHVPSDSRKLRQKSQELHQAVATWLSASELHVAGRVWRAFFTEVTSRARKGALPSFKIVLFAVQGDDFCPQLPDVRPGGDSSDRRSVVAIDHFINWFMPTEANAKSTNLKMFQRFALGLSKTEATVVLYPHEFIEKADKLGTDRETVMDDGCARMSWPLAVEISRMLGLEEVPSVFQGRISGAKGLWMVEYDEKEPTSRPRGFWIEVTDSQLKIQPHPTRRPDTDVENRTFEVLEWSGGPKPANLNIQFMTVLAHGEVPKELLRDRFKLVTNTYFKELNDAMHEPLLLRAWNQKYHGINHQSDQMKWMGAVPDDKSDQINVLLDSGFRPDECAFLLKPLHESLSSYLQRSVDKLAITIELSTSVWCIPDPYGILQPREVCLNFSRSWTDPKSRKQIRSLHGLQVLVSRSPALLPSDIQKVQGVSRPELEHITDVIIFSTRGDRPLASLLSGGDYDGDHAFVCFDPDIVDSFKNSVVDPYKLPGPEACGLINKSRKLSDFFKSDQPPSVQATNAFLQSAFEFNLRAPMLGICAGEFEKLIYERGLGDKGALTLAALAGHLVDSCKQGHLLTNEAWRRIRKSCCGENALPSPAYKENAERRAKEDHVVDYLKLIVAKQQMSNLLEAFEKAFPPASVNYDRVLSGVWHEYENRADAERKADRPELSRILTQLKKDVQKLSQYYAEVMGKNKEQDKSFPRAVESLHEAVLAIKPLPEQHQLCARYEQERHLQHSEWSQLRASSIYYRHYRHRLPFYAAGRDLCRIKAESVGPTQLVTARSYHMMKIDSKAVKRKYGRDEMDEDDAFVDAEQEVSFMDKHFGLG